VHGGLLAVRPWWVGRRGSRRLQQQRGGALAAVTGETADPTPCCSHCNSTAAAGSVARQGATISGAAWGIMRSCSSAFFLLPLAVSAAACTAVRTSSVCAVRPHSV
jgi:hypothetical protein